MVGYATSETANRMPLEYELARRLNEHIYGLHSHDGKTQVTLLDGRLVTVVCSWCHVSSDELKLIIDDYIASDDMFAGVVMDEYEKVVNPAGDWDMG